MMELEESYSAYFVQMQGVECVDLLVELGTDGSGRKMGGLERAEQAEPTVMQEQAEPLIWIMRKMQKRAGERSASVRGLYQ